MWSWNEFRIAFHFADLLILLMLWTAANELEFFPECLEGHTATHRRDGSPAIRSEKNESIQFCLGMLSFMVQTFSIITRNSKIELKLVVILIMFAERDSWNHPSRKETHRLRIVPVSEGCTRRPDSAPEQQTIKRSHAKFDWFSIDQMAIPGHLELKRLCIDLKTNPKDDSESIEIIQMRFRKRQFQLCETIWEIRWQRSEFHPKNIPDTFFKP